MARKQPCILVTATGPDSQRSAKPFLSHWNEIILSFKSFQCPAPAWEEWRMSFLILLSHKNSERGGYLWKSDMHKLKCPHGKNLAPYGSAEYFWKSDWTVSLGLHQSHKEPHSLLSYIQGLGGLLLRHCFFKDIVFLVMHSWHSCVISILFTHLALVSLA